MVGLGKMTPRLPAIYANAVVIRITDHELVLEFGSSFPDQPGQQAADFGPDVRVVLPVAALSGVIKTLTQLEAQRKPKTSSATLVGAETTEKKPS
jgi:hypothetical protein